MAAVTRTSLIGTFNTGDPWAESTIDALPAGYLGYSIVTTNQGPISTETALTGLSLTVSLNASRLIRVIGEVRTSATSAANRIGLRIKEGGTVLQQANHYSDVASQVIGPLTCSTLLTPTAGSHTYNLAMVSIDTGTIQLEAGATLPAFILLEDLGGV